MSWYYQQYPPQHYQPQAIVPYYGFGAVDDPPLVENPAAALTADDILVVDDTDTDIEEREKWTFSAPMANWIIGNVPGIAGGIVGFLLAQKLAKAYNVSASEVLFSTTLVVAATFAGLFLIRTYDEFEANT